MRARGMRNSCSPCGMEKCKFTELGLSAEILKAVDKMGFEEASPIQAAVIPTILEGTDRMIDMGFRDDIEHILKAVPATRQLLFFSATIPRMIQDLIGRYSKDPAWIKIESVAQNAPQVEQIYFEVDRRSKIEAL